MSNQYVLVVTETIPVVVTAPGVQGATGPAGSGGGSDAFFTFNQAGAANPWFINHNLNKYPSVTVVDSAGTQGFCSVTYVDANNVQLNFAAPFAGKAYLN